MRLFTLSTATQFTYFMLLSFFWQVLEDGERPIPIGHSDKRAWITSFPKLCELHEIDQYSAWLLHGGCWYFSIISMDQIKNITAFSAIQHFVN